MLIFEVIQEVDPIVSEEFKEWLPGHVEAAFKSGGFIKAELCAELPSTAESTKSRWNVRFYARDRRQLDEYLSNHAPRLRAETEKQFSGKYITTRRILMPTQQFPGK